MINDKQVEEMAVYFAAKKENEELKDINEDLKKENEELQESLRNAIMSKSLLSIDLEQSENIKKRLI